MLSTTPVALVVLRIVLIVRPALADPPPVSVDLSPPPALAPSSLAKGPNFTLNGYIEAAYAYSLQRPSNDIINERAFDDRHNTFQIENAVLDATATLSGLSARIALQIGTTPSTYYAAEPTLPGTSGAAGSSATDWKYVQQAIAGYRTDRIAQGLALEAGIFLSPIGPEVMQAKDDWNYSRSNLFFGLPFYHTGARLTLQATERTVIAFWIVNGWNSVIDNNEAKSIISTLTYTIPDRLIAQVGYIGGPERPKGAPEGQPNRHLFDAYAQVDVSKYVSLLAHGDVGFERNDFGTSSWAAGALYARVRPWKYLYLAARGDTFFEHRGTDRVGTASPIFFPASWVSSGTFTVDGRPHDNVSIRLEYRHDHASSDMYFQGTVKGDGVNTPYVPNATSQDTLTAALLAWF